MKADGPAATAGLRRGDIIREIDRKPIRNMRDYSRALSETAKNDVILLSSLERGESTIYVVVKPKD